MPSGRRWQDGSGHHAVTKAWHSSSFSGASGPFQSSWRTSGTNSPGLQSSGSCSNGSYKTTARRANRNRSSGTGSWANAGTGGPATRSAITTATTRRSRAAASHETTAGSRSAHTWRTTSCCTTVTGLRATSGDRCNAEKTSCSDRGSGCLWQHGRLSMATAHTRCFSKRCAGGPEATGWGEGSRGGSSWTGRSSRSRGYGRRLSPFSRGNGESGLTARSWKGCRGFRHSHGLDDMRGPTASGCSYTCSCATACT